MKITTEKQNNRPVIKEVKIKSVTVQHIIDAARLSGSMEGASFLAALLSQICEFDGQAKTYEDMMVLPGSVFLELSAALATSGVLPSEEVLSTLSAKDASAMKG